MGGSPGLSSRGLVGSGPSYAEGFLLPGFRRKMCRELESRSAHLKAFSCIGQGVNGRESSAAGLPAAISSSRRGLAGGCWADGRQHLPGLH